MKKHIFASDLDRTLIYSSHFLSQYVTEKPLMLVEYYKDQPLSYMTTYARKILEEIQQYAYFVPVTTRTTIQYQRIFGITSLYPEYAITYNGAVVLKDGQPDKEWEQYIEKQTNPFYQEMFNYMKSIPQNKRYYDVTHFMYAINEDATQDDKHIPIAKRFGFTMSRQGRKLYFIPSHICKSHAVKYVSEQLNVRQIFGAGDANLDVPFIKNATTGVLMKHGGVSSTLTMTQQVGVNATEEMLNKVIQFIHK